MLNTHKNKREFSIVFCLIVLLCVFLSQQEICEIFFFSNKYSVQ
jgi:hypothetical protein